MVRSCRQSDSLIVPEFLRSLRHSHEQSRGSRKVQSTIDLGPVIGKFTPNFGKLVGYGAHFHSPERLEVRSPLYAIISKDMCPPEITTLIFIENHVVVNDYQNPCNLKHGR